MRLASRRTFLGVTGLAVLAQPPVTFRSEGKEFSWTFNGLGGRAVDVAKIAPAGFPAKPLTVYIGRDPLTRQ